MKIKIQGFEWFLGKGISLEQLNSYLEEKSGVDINNKILAICQKDGFWTGVFLSIKNVKAYCQIKKGDGKFVITPQELEEGASIVDFNFFILHPNTGRGLYQYYHQSASSNTFCNFIKKRYNELKKRKMEQEIELSGGADITEKEYKKIIKKYKGTFSSTTLVRPDRFEDYIRDLKQIKSLSYEISTINVNEKDRTPLHRLAERTTYRAFFSDDLVNMDKIKKAIIEMNPTNTFRRATVTGIDYSDQEAMYKLLNDYESYAEYDYDDIIKTVKIDSSDLIGSVRNASMVATMIKMARNNRQIKSLLSKEAK